MNVSDDAAKSLGLPDKSHIFNLTIFGNNFKRPHGTIPQSVGG